MRRFPETVRAVTTMLCLTAVLLCAAAFREVTNRQNSPPPLQRTINETLSVNNARPVAEAAWELENRYGWAITYEDPIYMHSSEVVDVTTQVRRDLDRYKPGEAPKVFVPKGGGLSITFRVDSHTGRPVGSPESLMQQVLDANTAAGYSGRFRLQSKGGIVHVIPTAYKEKSGALVPYQSVLDSIITIPSQERTALQSLDLLCDALSRIAKTKVSLGTIDPNLFSHSRNQIGVNRVKARDFLVKLIESVNTSSSLSWRLLYDPTVKNYFLNIHPITK